METDLCVNSLELAAPAPPPQCADFESAVGSPRRGVDLSIRQRLLWPLVLRYARADLPSYGHLLHWFGMNDQPIWRRGSIVEVRDRFHGLKMRLNMADFFQRIAYFVGSYHEHDVLAALDCALRPGDAFLDGGANIGLVTLHAAGIVGPGGRIDAFECNPRLFGRLRWHKEANRLDQVHIHECALSETGGAAPLRLPGSDSAAAATLAPIPERYGTVWADLGETPLVTGDAALDPSDTRPLLIKLDVEGYELKALRGLRRTLEDRRPAVITELNGELLAKCGESPGDVYDFLNPLGYEPYGLERAGFRGGHRLRLHPLSRERLLLEKDALWIVPNGTHWARLQEIVQPRDQHWRH